MIRNVSREDYLLARAPNPRTGIVTPGIHSANSSIDEIAELRSRGLAPPGKWRQRGNQWISLEYDQPTPLTTPSCEAGPRLRTPPRLTASKYRQGRMVPRPADPTEGAVASNLDKAIDTKGEVPGAYPQTPGGVQTRSAPSGQTIPRKAVGSPLRTATSNVGPLFLTDGGPEIPRLPPLAYAPEHAQRSSSAPTPWKPYPFSPMDVGKDLPGLKDLHQGPVSPGLSENIVPFLGQQKPRSTSGAARTTQANMVRKLDKELPCLPMNSGPSQSPQTFRVVSPPNTESKHATRLRKDTRTSPEVPVSALLRNHSPVLEGRPSLRGPRQMDVQYPLMRLRSPQLPQILDRPAIRPSGGRMMGVPEDDNVPLSKQEQLRRRMLEHRESRLNRPEHRTIPTSFDDILLAPIGISTSISTSTDTCIDILPSRHSRPLFGPQDLPNGQNTNRRSTPEHTKHHRGYVAMNTSTSSSDLIDMPVQAAQYRSRAGSRPQMPDRSDAMRSVPTLRPVPQHPRGRDHGTAPSHQWSMIGMPITPKVVSDADGAKLARESKQDFLQADFASQAQSDRQNPDPMKTSMRGLAGLNAPNSSRTHADGLYRRCSRCSHGYVQGQILRSHTVGRDSSADTFQTAPKAHIECAGHGHGDGGEGDSVAREPAVPERVGISKPATLQNLPIALQIAPLVHKSDSCAQEAGLTIKNMPPQRDTSTVAANRTALMRPEIIPRRGSENPLQVASPREADHSGCCPQCCRESDCHDGCLGHPSPSVTPSICTSSTDPYPNSRSGSITSLEGQPLTPLSERNKKLSFVKVAFKKGFQKSNITSKEAQSPTTSSRITHATDIASMPIELSCGPRSPRVFTESKRPEFISGGVSHLAAAAAKNAIGGTTSPTGCTAEAAVAAKSAIGLKTLGAKEGAGALSKRRKNSKDGGEGDADDTSSVRSKRTVTPNEGRPLSGLCRSAVTEDSVSVKSLTRTASVVSKASTLDIQLPTTTIGAIAEMILIPLEVSRMWLRNHPGVSKSGWQVMNRIWTMALVVLATSEGCWRMVYVYSKTGKCKAPKLNGKTRKEGWSFLWDCFRSLGYLIVLGALTVLCVRVMRWIVGVLKVVLFIMKGLLWVSKVLLGGGTGW